MRQAPNTWAPLQVPNHLANSSGVAQPHTTGAAHWDDQLSPCGVRALFVLQVITSADFHPESCSIFAFSSSKGCIRLADMRESALCDRHSKAFEEKEPQARALLH